MFNPESASHEIPSILDFRRTYCMSAGTGAAGLGVPGYLLGDSHRLQGKQQGSRGQVLLEGSIG